MDKTCEQSGVVDGVEREGFRVAVIGGGPGGMFTAWHLGAKAGPACQITVANATTAKPSVPNAMRRQWAA